VSDQSIVEQRRENPLWRPHFAGDEEGEKAVDRYVQVKVDTRHDAIESLYARGHLSLAEKQAGDIMRAYWETYSRSSLQGIDYERDRVSGGRSPSPVTNDQIAARDQLRRARIELGRQGFHLMVEVCGKGKTLREIVGDDNRKRTTAADNLRMHLNDLARVFGLWAKGKRKRA